MSDRKIPSTCRTCGQTLTALEMERFLAASEKHGRDPVEVAYLVTPPGIACNISGCGLRAYLDYQETRDAVVAARILVDARDAHGASRP